jgi:hypothetical protein
MLQVDLFRNAHTDEYYRRLMKEYEMLSVKYSLLSLHGWLWKFSRLRPVNFPTVRISQLAAMLSAAGGIFSKALEADNINVLKGVFEVSASEYWNDHYLFGKKSKKVTKNTGSQATDILLINAVIPMLFFYGKSRDNKEISEKALDFLENIQPEVNIIIQEWKSAGIISESAFYSQALIQLRNNYCKKRRCLECRIGSKLIIMGSRLKNQDELILEP